MRGKLIGLMKDEPYFVLRGRNPFAVMALKAYASALREVGETTRAIWTETLAERFLAWHTLYPSKPPEPKNSAPVVSQDQNAK